MPSGVSAETTVSSTYVGLRVRSGFNDDGSGNLVVQTLPRFPEDEERVYKPVERDNADKRLHDIAQPDDAPDRDGRSIGAYDLDVEELLGDRLAIATHAHDR